MGNLVIVAIPAEDDLVWKISSEKVPHLTLLYLGETDDDDEGGDTPDSQRMAEFVEHALNISEHGPFYLDVDYRDTLGPDNADVLFFANGWDSKWIKQLRGQLLQQDDIREAYDTANQFPEWQPHLTLGYPTAPAKPVPDDRKIYSVQFDKIAVWNDNYEGPEFRLKWPERDSNELAVAYADMGKAAIDDVLNHHGVKGMRWGTRSTKPISGNSETVKAALFGQFAVLSPKFREHTSSSTQVKVSLFGAYALLDKGVRNDLKQASDKIAVSKADKQWEHGLKDGSAFVAVNNKAAEHFNSHIDGLNKKYPENRDWSKEDFNNPHNSKDPEFKSYMKDVSKLTQDSIAHAANELQLKNPSGTKEVEITNPSGLPGDYHLTAKEVAHASEAPSLDIQVKFKTDATGRVTGFEIPQDEVTHKMELGESFVAHQSVLDNPTLAQQIKAKIQDILDDVDGDTDGDVALFGDPLIRAKLQSVLNDFYQDPNIDKALINSALGEAFIQHYGKLGMKWGIRSASSHLSAGGKVARLRQEGDKLHSQAKTAHPSKAAELRAKGDEKHKQANEVEKKAKDYLKGPDAVAPHATSRVPFGDKRKTKIETEGGQNHPAHEDALHVARAQEKLKKSGLSALSNKELNDVANRVQLEERVSMLTASKGKLFIRKHLTGQGNQLAKAGLREGVRNAPTVARVAKRGAAIGLSTAALM